MLHFFDRLVHGRQQSFRKPQNHDTSDHRQNTKDDHW